jgi:Conserved mid region of cactin
VVKAEKDDEQYQQWLAKEDDFMLVQAKKRAVIRVREGREKPIDALVINLNLIEGKKQRQRLLGDDEFEADGGEFYITEPDELIKVLPPCFTDGANNAATLGRRKGRAGTGH